MAPRVWNKRRRQHHGHDTGTIRARYGHASGTQCTIPRARHGHARIHGLVSPRARYTTGTGWCHHGLVSPRARYGHAVTGNAAAARAVPMLHPSHTHTLMLPLSALQQRQAAAKAQQTRSLEFTLVTCAIATRTALPDSPRSQSRVTSTPHGRNHPRSCRRSPPIATA